MCLHVVLRGGRAPPRQRRRVAHARAPGGGGARDEPAHAARPLDGRARPSLAPPHAHSASGVLLLSPSCARPQPILCPSLACPLPVLCPCFVLVLCPSRHSAAPAPSAAALIFQGLQGGRASAWCPRAARHFQPLRPQPLGPQRPNRDHLAGSREIAAPPKSLNPLRACAACVCHVRIAQRWST